MRTGWSVRLVVFLLAVASLAFGQVGNGTITGIVTDPAGAVVAGAKVEAKNAETGVVFSAQSTNAGNYTITDLPVGSYVVKQPRSPGFKTYTHTNMEMAAAGTLREDIALQVGSSSESVTVTAESTLLKTEGGDVATNITVHDIDELPLMGIGVQNSGTSGYRNPYNVTELLPGVVNYSAANALGLNVNGLTMQSMLVDGQDASTRVLGIGGTGQYYQIGQMGVDSIQEVSYQTSNYAPEYGMASSVVINNTMKSGTNAYHGSAYDYVVNEDLNAGEPFSISGCETGVNGVQTCSGLGGSGGKYQPRQRRQDFGGTLGGPVFIPKIYNGHNKTFWFFSYEQYAETDFYTFGDTVAVPAYIAGNFSAISPNGNCSLCSTYGIQQTALGTPAQQKDPLGNLMYANEIYDPSTRGTVVSGLRARLCHCPSLATSFPQPASLRSRSNSKRSSRRSESTRKAPALPAITPRTSPVRDIRRFRRSRSITTWTPKINCRSSIRRTTPWARFPRLWATRTVIAHRNWRVPRHLHSHLDVPAEL